MAASLLTPATLRWPTLSAEIGKEGKKIKFFLTLFMAFHREGGQA